MGKRQRKRCSGEEARDLLPRAQQCARSRRRGWLQAEERERLATEASQVRLLARARTRQLADVERQLAQTQESLEAATSAASQQQKINSQSLADALLALSSCQKVRVLLTFLLPFLHPKDNASEEGRRQALRGIRVLVWVCVLCVCIPLLLHGSKKEERVLKGVDTHEASLKGMGAENTAPVVWMWFRYLYHQMST